MRRVLCLILLACLVLSAVVVAGIRAHDTEVPDVDFLQQALLSQQDSWGQSLDVTYTLKAVGSPSSNGASVVLESTCRYIWTPNKVRLDIEDETRSRHCALDTNSKVFRQLTIRKASGKSSGLIDDRYTGELGNRAIPNFVMFPFDLGTVPELVKRGSVQPARQDGCWVVETVSAHMPGVAYRVHVDPAIGFCPRRVEILWPDTDPEVIDFLEYSNLGEGIWYPKEIRDRYRIRTEGEPKEIAGKTVEVVISTKDVQIDRPVSDGDLRVDFPSGTQVYDRVIDQEYLQP